LFKNKLSVSDFRKQTKTSRKSNIVRQSGQLIFEQSLNLKLQMSSKPANRSLKLMNAGLLCLIAVMSCAFHNAQVSFRQTDFARYPEGDARTINTAQYLIHRENLTRRALQFGRKLFHQDFAADKTSGCNGVPCAQRDAKATTARPQSRFEAGSCATCHSNPAGSAGFGDKEHFTFTAGNTIRSPDMFGAGLIEQLALEASEDLKAANAARKPLVTGNGVNYDSGLGIRDGGGVNRDLIIRPFGRKGIESHVRAFAIRAAFNHLGLQAQDRFQCPDGDKNGDGRCDGAITEGLDPDGDGAKDELTQGALSLIEHYLRNYPMPGRGPVTNQVRAGEQLFKTIGCAECHRPEMRIRHDPRIEHLTVFWNEEAKRFEAERRWLHHTTDDGYLDPDRRRPVLRVEPKRQPFVAPLYSDLKRHEMGAQMADTSDEEGVAKTVFITRPLWGVGSYTTFLHDGSATTIEEAILRHGGEALDARNEYAKLSAQEQQAVTGFLRSLILFSVEDVLTAKIPITRGDLP
jgi:mono/diheme cytochrome c family protein